jgi:hypothetical protein
VTQQNFAPEARQCCVLHRPANQNRSPHTQIEQHWQYHSCRTANADKVQMILCFMRQAPANLGNGLRRRAPARAVTACSRAARDCSSVWPASAVSFLHEVIPAAAPEIGH